MKCRHADHLGRHGDGLVNDRAAHKQHGRQLVEPGIKAVGQYREQPVILGQLQILGHGTRADADVAVA